MLPAEEEGVPLALVFSMGGFFGLLFFSLVGIEVATPSSPSSEAVSMNIFIINDLLFVSANRCKKLGAGGI